MQKHLTLILCLELSQSLDLPSIAVSAFLVILVEFDKSETNKILLCSLVDKKLCLLFFIYVFSSNFHLSTLFQHFGERYIKFIVTYCNTKCGNQNIWLCLQYRRNLQAIEIDSQIISSLIIASCFLCRVQKPPSPKRLCCQVLSNFQESSFTFFQPCLGYHSFLTRTIFRCCLKKSIFMGLAYAYFSDNYAIFTLSKMLFHDLRFHQFVWHFLFCRR